MNAREFEGFNTFLENKGVIKHTLAKLFDENEIALILSTLISNTEKIKSVKMNCCSLSDMKDRLKETTVSGDYHFSVVNDLIDQLGVDGERRSRNEYNFMVLKTGVNGIRNYVNVIDTVRGVIEEINSVEILETKKFSVFYLVDNTLYLEVADNVSNNWKRKRGWKAWNKLCSERPLLEDDINILLH